MALAKEDREVLARLDERSEHQQRFNQRMEAWMLKHEKHVAEELQAVREDIGDVDDKVDSVRGWQNRIVGGGAVLTVLWGLALAYVKGLFSSGGAS